MPLNRLVYILYSIKTGDFLTTLSYSLLIKERGFPVAMFTSLLIIRIGYGVIRIISFLLLIKERGFPYPNLFIFLFSISIRKGDMVSTSCISTFVPLLYHIYKHLSSDLNTYFKIIYNYFILYSIRRGEMVYSNYSYLLLIKERGFPYDNYSLSTLTLQSSLRPLICSTFNISLSLDQSIY